MSGPSSLATQTRWFHAGSGPPGRAIRRCSSRSSGALWPPKHRSSTANCSLDARDRDGRHPRAVCLRVHAARVRCRARRRPVVLDDGHVRRAAQTLVHRRRFGARVVRRHRHRVSARLELRVRRRRRRRHHGAGHWLRASAREGFARYVDRRAVHGRVRAGHLSHEPVDANRPSICKAICSATSWASRAATS